MVWKMELLNYLIAAIDEAGMRNDMYGTINTISHYFSILFGILHGRKLKASIPTVIVSALVVRYISGPLVTLILYVENGFSPTKLQNAVVMFAFVPLIGFLVSKLLKKSYKEIWDIMMVVPIVMFAGARIACTVAGCCRGYPCTWGVYNADAERLLFPIQLLESLVSVLILVYVLWREKHNHFIPDGRNVPIILISYGIARFFLEFLHDNKKIIYGLASTQFHCLLMILVGVVTLHIIQKSERKVLS